MRTINEIATEMAEHVCDRLCRFPYILDQGALDDFCSNCDLSKYVIELNEVEVKYDKD